MYRTVPALERWTAPLSISSKIGSRSLRQRVGVRRNEISADLRRTVRRRLLELLTFCLPVLLNINSSTVTQHFGNSRTDFCGVIANADHRIRS